MVNEVSALYRLSAVTVAAILAVSLVAALAISSYFGGRTAHKPWHADLSSLETMASGLLGLLLAFNFSIAQGRFDARQEVIIKEADAIGTAYLRCSVLEENDRRACRDLLRRYAHLRIAGYAAYGQTGKEDEVRRDLKECERLQNELWAIVARVARDRPNPVNALVMSGLNEVIDLDSDRRASIRIAVPQAVSVVILLACVAWAVLLGYSSGTKRNGSLTAWMVVSVLISVVFGVAVDFDRPRSGVITTAASERALTNVARSMDEPPVD